MDRRLMMHPTADHCRFGVVQRVVRSGLRVILLAMMTAVAGCASFQQGGEARSLYERQLEQQSAAHMITAPAHWLENRLADFMDIFELGVGLSSENKGTGWFPGSLGLHVEATSFINVGALTHNGATLDWEGRGLGAYTESRTDCGFGPIRSWRIYQGGQHVNFYKDPQRSKEWAKRMREDLGAYTPVAAQMEAAQGPEGQGKKRDGSAQDPAGETIPAKQLIHRDLDFNTRWFGRPKGWQHWGTIGAEAAISEPFLLHHGIMVKAKVDASEILDFVLGFVGYDFKQDDRQDNE